MNMTEETPQPDDKHFKLHIGPAQQPKQDQKLKKVLGVDKIEQSQQNKQPFQKFHKNHPEEEAINSKETFGNRIWGYLRFISTAAIIFIVMFFAMNWNAYQTIVLNKLGLLNSRQEITELEELTVHGVQAEDQPQELMELSKDPDEQKSQIPGLELAVTPPDNRIIIPNINKNVPVIGVSADALVNRDWDRLEQVIQEALRDGVVHYPGSANPGEGGNVVITGHSSYFVWDAGRFKDVFALLHDVQIGDKIYMYDDQKQYIYEIYDTQVVLPTQVDVLTQDGSDRLTLITCTPVGTNLKRLIVFARPIN